MAGPEEIDDMCKFVMSHCTLVGKTAVLIIIICQFLSQVDHKKMWLCLDSFIVRRR